MKKILFITHDTSRSGAPLVLLYFMEWLRANKNGFEIDCLSLNNGALDTKFSIVSNKFHQLGLKRKVSIQNKIYCKLLNTTPKKKYEDGILKIIKSADYDIVYANTVVSLKWGALIKKAAPKLKLILHLHELEVVIQTQCPKFNKYKSMVDHWICASELVRSNLLINNQVDIFRTTVVYEFSKLPKNLPKPKKRKTYTPLLIGASGGVNRRKGYDLFISVAKEINNKYPNIDILFEWVGKFPNRTIQAEVESDILKSGLKNVVVFKGEEINPFKSFMAFDLFLMTSREDPFPLVCIEVGSLGKPIICFEGATGTEEILKLGGGKIVPYLSINDMANEIINYVNDKEALYFDGIQAQINFKKFTIENQAPKLFDVINSFHHD